MDYRLDDLLHVISNIMRNLEVACFDVLMHFCFHLSYDFLGQLVVTVKILNLCFEYTYSFLRALTEVSEYHVVG